MTKNVRNAVRCFLIKNDQVICIKHKVNRVGYYDIPGGKIEDGETPTEAAIREFKEETGLTITNPIFRGMMYVNYPERSFIFHTFITNDYKGKLIESDDNSVEWAPIDQLLKKDKRFSNIVILENCFIKALTNNEDVFEMYIEVDNDENILELNFKVKKNKA